MMFLNNNKFFIKTNLVDILRKKVKGINLGLFYINKGLKGKFESDKNLSILIMLSFFIYIIRKEI